MAPKMVEDLGPNKFGPVRELSCGWVGLWRNDMYAWTTAIWNIRADLVQRGFEIGTYRDSIAISRRLLDACVLYYKRDNYADMSLLEFLEKLGINRK